MKLNTKDFNKKKRIKFLCILLGVLAFAQIFSALVFPNLRGHSEKINPDSNYDQNYLKEHPYNSNSISSWWNDSWNYRVRIDITAQEKIIKNVPIEKRLNQGGIL